MSGFAGTIGLNEEYYDSYFSDFISVMHSGQVFGSGSGAATNPFGVTNTAGGSSTASNPFGTGSSASVEDEDWYNSDLAEQYEASNAHLDSSLMEITQNSDGSYVLYLSDEDWELITEAVQEIYWDDGEGYLALGTDDYYEWDDNGGLIVDFDYYWHSLNGIPAAYYVDEIGQYDDGSTYSLAYIPALLNGETNIKIYVLFDYEDSESTVLGYRETYSGEYSSRGYSSFEKGDVIDFVYDYFTYGDEFDASYTLEGFEIVYDPDEGLQEDYIDLQEALGLIDIQLFYRLTDIYGNSYWTQPLYLSFE